jgi:sulfatase modifying factor 1
MKSLLLLIACAASSLLCAQNLPVMQHIEGGTRVMGGGYQYAIKDYYMVLLGGDTDYAGMNQDAIVIGEIPSENNPKRQVTIASFYMSETEVTNAQYRMFLMDSLLNPQEKAALESGLKKAKKETAEAQLALWKPLFAKAAATGLLPDTACWQRDFAFSYNGPLTKNYLWHNAFDGYPVVGVTWDQAQAYCSWLSGYVNAERIRQGKPMQPAYRLPTEAEWEYAAKPKLAATENISTNHQYPWAGWSVTNARGEFRLNIKTDHGNYSGDGYEYTAPAKSFEANDHGLYNMAGNVSEWCTDVFRFSTPEKFKSEDPAGGLRQFRNPGNQVQLLDAAATLDGKEQRVVKGGSWADYKYAALAGSRTGLGQNQSGSRVGFRVAMIKVGNAAATF